VLKQNLLIGTIKKQKVKTSDSRWVIKNQIIEIYHSRAQEILLEAILKKKTITASNFILKMKSNFTSRSFFSFADSVIKEKKDIVGSGTHKNYSYQINKIKAFRKEFELTDIDLTFIRDYQAFLKDELKNKDSTQTKSLKFLRMICLEAIKHDILTKNPFINFRIKEVKGREDYLSFEELEKLENLYKSESLNTGHQNVLRYFLFACYTGIAHGDLKKLRFSDVKKVVIEEKEFLIIDNERIKTGTRYRVPLIPKAAKLLGRKFQPYQKLFRVYTNQPTNRHLKNIAKKCGITKNISFHIARHTFGTHGTSFGIPEKLIMEMMGHKDLKVSRMYSKIENETLIKSMADKWKSE